MSDLLELAKRCEKASGTDRELDELISAAMQAAVREVQSDGRTAYHSLDGRLWVNIRVPDPGYTASIDAALTLVPEGMVAAITNCGGLESFDESGLDFTKATAIVGEPDEDREPTEAATPALALCAAALKARAALAAGTRSAEITEELAQSEGCQSGPQGNAQKEVP